MLKTAYKFMKFDKVKSIGVIIGIVVSIFLIGQQIGILTFLTGLMGGLVDNSRQNIGQIWVIDNITRNANELAKLDVRLVQEIRSVEGVENTYPIVAATDTIINCTTNAFTVTLPDAAVCTGKSFIVKNSNTLASAKAITIAVTSAQTIDGAAGGDSLLPLSSRTYTSNGANWLLT